VLLFLKYCKACDTHKSRVDFYKLNSAPDRLQYRCKACHKKANAKWNKTDSAREIFRKNAIKQRIKNKDNPVYLDRKSKQNKSYRSSGKGKANNLKWKKDNKGLVNADCAKRRAAKIKAVPKWADLSRVKEIYKSCREGYHVDHIYPLISNWVCGLHCEDNLQHLIAKANLSKSNRRVQDRNIIS